tara:strand:+ start:110 stop:397 length:288 start_codon:yes stop_codon:yes gene_type:complete
MNKINELPDEIWDYIKYLAFDWKRSHKQKMKMLESDINGLYGEYVLYHTNLFGDIYNLNDRFNSLWARHNLCITSIGWNLKGQNKWWYGFGWRLR